MSIEKLYQEQAKSMAEIDNITAEIDNITAKINNITAEIDNIINGKVSKINKEEYLGTLKVERREKLKGIVQKDERIHYILNKGGKMMILRLRNYLWRKYHILAGVKTCEKIITGKYI